MGSLSVVHEKLSNTATLLIILFMVTKRISYRKTSIIQMPVCQFSKSVQVNKLVWMSEPHSLTIYSIETKLTWLHCLGAICGKKFHGSHLLPE